MANESEMIAQPTNKGTSWMPIIASSLLSGAVSATVGYLLGRRPSTACSCKKKPNNNGVGGEKAA